MIHQIRALFPLLSILCLAISAGAQSDSTHALIDLPSHFIRKIQDKSSSLNNQLTQQTAHYLQKMQRREARLQKKLYKLDSNAAKSLFAGTRQQYTALSQKLAADTGNAHASYSGAYQPYTDSLQGMLKFLRSRQTAGTTSADPRVQSTLSQLQTLQAKTQDADQIKAYIQQRKQQLGDYISQHTNLSTLLGKDYQGMNEDLYYYSQQVQQYKDMLNDPDKLEQQALAILNKLPSFQTFMKENSQLAGLFGLPANYGSAQALPGLQTRDQVSALIQNQVSAGGAGGAAALQSNLQSAESQLDGYKDKLNQLGNSGGDIDIPDFKPNNQKTKTFWKRLEYGVNFQTTRDNYYFPTVTDFGGSIGYKLSDRSTIGVGASYKLGWGNGIQHIAFSNQGAGLRSFIDIKIKGSFSATGGLEYNYTTPFAAYQDLRVWNDWTKSGLIGITKTISMKNRFFKKTNLQLLWDFLSYQQVPKTQPLLFRVGYNF